MLSRFWKLFAGFGLKDAPKDAASGFSEALTILGIVITQTFAFVAVSFNTENSSFVSAAMYGVMSVAALGCLVGIHRSRHPTAVPPAHYFDRGTIVFTRWIIFWSLVFTVSAVSMGVSGALPGQRPSIELKEKFAYPYAFKRPANVLGLRVSIRISTLDFPEGIPERMRVMVGLEDDLEKKWRIVGVEGYRGVFKNDPEEDAKSEMKDPPTFNKEETENISSEGTEFPVYVRGLDSRSYHSIVLRLLPRSYHTDNEETAKSERDSLMELIKSGKGFSARAIPNK